MDIEKIKVGDIIHDIRDAGALREIAGKGLSTNDYTNEDKSKLEGIEADAQKNKIESIKVNGSDVTPDSNKAVNVIVPTKMSDLNLDGGDMASGASLRFKNASSSMVIQPFGIVKESNEQSHVISFPDKQGTVALTSDIPDVSGKQDTIQDLSEIRSGAALANNSDHRPYNSSDPDGMGYLVLKKNKTFAEQVTEANTIYEIREKFVLSEDVTMPSGSALRFNGGEISGSGTLTFNETEILGNAKITCVISGIILGIVHAEWFGMVAGDQSFDNSPIIQKVCKTFSFVTIDGDDYYCATPIELYSNALRGLTINANLHYVTSGADTFLTIGGSLVDIRIHGSILGPAVNNTGGDDRTIGIKFHDLNNSRVYVKNVRFFYTNVQVYGGVAGIGNAYNTYEFVELAAANILLELKADNPGWVTSDKFSVGRMTSYGGYTTVETAILIHADVSGFSDVVFDKLTIEGVQSSEPVKIINANRISFYNVRNEGNNANFFYADNVSVIKTRFNYGEPTVRAEPGSICHFEDLNDEYAPYAPLDGAISIPGGSGQMLLFNAIDPTKAQMVNYSPMYYIPIGFIVPVTKKSWRFSAKDSFDVTVVYYDASLTPIQRNEQYMPSGMISFKNSAVITNGYVATSLSTIQTVALPALPEGCSYVGYFFHMTHSKTYFNGRTPIFSIPVRLSVGAIKNVLTYGARAEHNEYGTTAQRPTFAEDYRQYLVGFEYFDTSLGKPVYAKTIASDGTATWVDATGASV